MRNFFLGFGDELIKLSFSQERAMDFLKKNPELAKSLATGAGEGASRGAVKELAEKVGPSAKGAILGGLAGKALFRRGALGALAGLGVVHRGKVMAAARQAKQKAEEAMRRKK